MVLAKTKELHKAFDSSLITIVKVPSGFFLAYPFTFNPLPPSGVSPKVKVTGELWPLVFVNSAMLLTNSERANLSTMQLIRGSSVMELSI